MSSLLGADFAQDRYPCRQCSAGPAKVKKAKLSIFSEVRVEGVEKAGQTVVAGVRGKVPSLAGEPGTDSDAEYYTGFRTIPLGDIDLQREIQFDGCSGVASLRRLHSARVEGKASDVSVAVYQGAGAKQEWRQDIARYRAIRHPNVVQLYGTVSCGTVGGKTAVDLEIRHLSSAICRDGEPEARSLTLGRERYFIDNFIKECDNKDIEICTFRTEKELLTANTARKKALVFADIQAFENHNPLNKAQFLFDLTSHTLDSSCSTRRAREHGVQGIKTFLGQHQCVQKYAQMGLKVLRDSSENENEVVEESEPENDENQYSVPEFREDLAEFC
ncbi:hypothetical protein C8R45DRAFT_940651 [Mycena sanguinolenta]|nr:hypothetical protein C8R45DRAFT_940651 [Mycena sanguinolenta]